MVKYRVKHVSKIGYFAQVKRGLFSGWEKIGIHNNGFGEYKEDNLNYPQKTLDEACKIIRAYIDYHAEKEKKITFYDIEPLNLTIK